MWNVWYAYRGSVHISPANFENTVLFPTVGPTLIRHENEAFRSRSSKQRNLKIHGNNFGLHRSILVPRATIILTCGRDRELWLGPIFWACAEYSFQILSQSDLPDLTGSPEDFCQTSILQSGVDRLQIRSDSIICLRCKIPATDCGRN